MSEATQSLTSALPVLQAAQAYDAAARSIRGDTAVCNFPLAEGQTAPAAPQR